MQRRYVTVDVFTDRVFGGNPLAVVLDAQGLKKPQMQAIATEFNYAETTFVLPPRAADHTAHVRIFTPRTEVPFAGHPNVGTAVVFAREWDREREANAKGRAAHRSIDSYSRKPRGSCRSDSFDNRTPWLAQSSPHLNP